MGLSHPKYRAVPRVSAARKGLCAQLGQVDLCPQGVCGGPAYQLLNFDSNLHGTPRYLVVSNVSRLARVFQQWSPPLLRIERT